MHICTAWFCPMQQWQVVFAEFGSVSDLNPNFFNDEQALDLFGFVMKRGSRENIQVLISSPPLLLTRTCLNRTSTQAPIWVLVQHQPYCRGTWCRYSGNEKLGCLCAGSYRKQGAKHFSSPVQSSKKTKKE